MNFNSIKKWSPYDRFRQKNASSDITSWIKPFDTIVFHDVIGRSKPKTIIELGSFLGYSIINMLDKCYELNLHTKCICVDTWLGGSDHMINMYNKTDDLFYKYFNIDDGISGVFDQFCINVLNKSYDEDIIPVVNTTDNAYIYLEKCNIKVDLIYIDACHSENQLYRDMKQYHNLLNKGGTMFGHDINWKSVRLAVDRFCKEYDYVYTTHYNKYWELNIGNF